MKIEPQESSKVKKYPHLIFPHTQVITFDNGTVREIPHVIEVKEGKWIHMICDDGHDSSEVLLNPNRILFVRIKS